MFSWALLKGPFYTLPNEEIGGILMINTCTNVWLQRELWTRWPAFAKSQRQICSSGVPWIFHKRNDSTSLDFARNPFKDHLISGYMTAFNWSNCSKPFVYSNFHSFACSLILNISFLLSICIHSENHNSTFHEAQIFFSTKTSGDSLPFTFFPIKTIFSIVFSSRKKAWWVDWLEQRGGTW